MSIFYCLVSISIMLVFDSCICQYLTIFLLQYLTFAFSVFNSCFLSVFVTIWQLLLWCTVLTWQLSILCSHTGVIFCSVWWISHWKNKIIIIILCQDFKSWFLHVEKQQFLFKKLLFLAYILFFSFCSVKTQLNLEWVLIQHWFYNLT